MIIFLVSIGDILRVVTLSSFKFSLMELAEKKRDWTLVTEFTTSFLTHPCIELILLLTLCHIVDKFKSSLVSNDLSGGTSICCLLRQNT